ncbi:MAG: U32 family peptidase, partial [Bacteroidaceae bacterium]|nr:U32 family peptidase [Bacteroidaceae bacterium]
MILKTYIELLAPARNLECGMAAVDHGADAVYIGAQRFGARAAAGNSVEDIASLCRYAHKFAVKVYVTVNTILYDEELDATEKLVWQLYEAGVDALIVQDLALLKMNLPPIPLHASTQMDNRTPEQVQWLADMGYSQVVLARECSLEQIRLIHETVPQIPLEAFVHGALCVSYSGRCQASQFCFSRSANRGQCAQFCRLPFSLVDADGKVLAKEKYLLSLRDINRTASLEKMMDAGIRSFKIEGRLKDVSYVKNVTAWYRRRIDEILRRRPEYGRASLGTVELNFQPNPQRSFSRGFTEYFLHERTKMASFHTPKSMGQDVGVVKEVRGGCIIVSSVASFANGDGLCYLDADGKLKGFRVNRADGNHLYPAEQVNIRPRTPLYRSFDQEWERMMARPTAVRTLSVEWTISDVEEGFCLKLKREDGVWVERIFPW